MTANVPYPYEAGMAEAWITKSVRQIEEDEACNVAVVRRETPDHIGAVGLTLGARDAPVLGYWIGRPHWGHGYATEAAGAFVAFGFDALDAKRIDATVRPGNAASAGVLAKLGFTRTGRIMQDAPARGAPQEVDSYELSRPAFEARHDG